MATISTSLIKRNQVKLPHELATHPFINDAAVKIEDDIVTFKLPPAKVHENMYADIWQYIHSKQKWVQMTFTK